MYKLFAYGSLICQDIMTAVAGDCLRVGDAVLHDHRRLGVKDQHYPGMIAVPGFSVPGVVYADLDDRALARLDEFEGEMYRRVALVVEMADAGRQEVFSYVIRPDYRHLLTASDWHYEDFLRQGKDAFVAEYLGFQRIGQGD